ncbi:hypothetical protein [Paenibacillus sp. NPDC058174]|uniref:hypothetical protein n=1 Tax=Paenibacillus sp. NPDC058174 TaxID=3346366 RepID=UPI0036DBCA1C
MKSESTNDKECVVDGVSPNSNSNTIEATSLPVTPSRGWRPILLKALGITARILLARHPAALSREAGCFWYGGDGQDDKRD